MTTITTHEAKTHLSRYLAAVEQGEEFIIARARKPVARLVAWDSGPARPRPKVGMTMDAPIHVPSEAFAPLSKKERKEWGL